VVERPHDFFASPLDHLNDFALPLFVFWSPGGNGHPNEVTVEGLPHVGLLNKELLVAVHGLDEAVSLSMCAENARVVLRIRGVLVLATLALHDAIGAHLGENVAEAEIPVVILDVEALSDFVGAKGLTGVLLKKREDVLSKRFGCRVGNLQSCMLFAKNVRDQLEPNDQEESTFAAP